MIRDLWIRFKYRNIVDIDTEIIKLCKTSIYSYLKKHGLSCYNGESKRFHELKRLKEIRLMLRNK